MGDVVHIVEEKVGMASGWVSDMLLYLGRETVITSARTHYSLTTGVYSIEADGGDYCWNDEAFQEFYHPVISEEEFLKILG